MNLNNIFTEKSQISESKKAILNEFINSLENLSQHCCKTK